jgi:DNA (cytosine-5)-methyltransferase 1
MRVVVWQEWNKPLGAHGRVRPVAGGIPVQAEVSGMTTYGSLFSGVGGFDLGCDAAGWDCKWQVEYDARCRQVLARHWPGVNRYDDVRIVNGFELTPVDVITYGFPCQDLSVAGKRAGLDGDRSGLFFEAIRIIREMREATDGTFPRVAVAENVVGLLSADGGDAMGRCLDALAEVGAVAVEWRVLDAQWFGVPQRRRRVFLVAVFDPRTASAGPVFPEPESVRGDLAAQREAGETVAGTLGGGSGERGWACDTDRMTFVPAVTGTVTTTWAKGPGNTQVEEGLCIPAFVKAKRAQSVDDDETWKPDGPAPTLNAFDNNSETRATVLAPAALGVRRLTPRECERLQGWPDDHTRYTIDGTEVPDSARYRMAGNGVAAPVAKYVAECVERVLNNA